MKIIGITGGIASGKTTVAHMFAAHGFVHLDSDFIVHRLMREDKEIIADISRLFPSSLVGGEISRRVLSEIVSKDETALPKLESIIHPRVAAEESGVIEALRRKNSKGVVLDIPLLFETGAEKRCDVVIVVHVPTEVARKRAFTRPGMTEAKWDRLTRRQLDERDRCLRADHVIPTDTSEEETRRHVEALIQKWELLDA